MAVEVVVPSVGDSISEVMLGAWHKQVGDRVKQDEPLVEFESEKISQDIVAPAAGVLTKILRQSGDTVPVGEAICVIDATGAPVAGAPTAGAPAVASPAATTPAAPAAPAASNEPRVMPAAERMLVETGTPTTQVNPSGPGGRILKEDVQKAMTVPAAPTAPTKTERPQQVVSTVVAHSTAKVGGRGVTRKTMSPIRKTIAQRLVEAQHNAALLTTFNEVDMTNVMSLRKQHQDAFTERHGIKLGFMSFFVKAAVDALQAFPAINAQIHGNEIVYHDYCDIGIAIGGGKGLVVPVLRNAETMGFAAIEQAIGEFAKRAQNGTLGPDDLKGGTFTISNGGVYGSLLSTPIVNPPQSGVLGMHATQDRPVARDGQVVIRPMMYLALTYDHRIVDGREAVTFLKRIKDLIENPVRLLLEV